MSATTFSQLAGYRGWSIGEFVKPLRAPWRSFRRRLLRRPGSTLAITTATVLSGTILTNAIAFQTERHPSPMFTPLGAGIEATEAQVPTPPARPQVERQKADATAVAPKTKVKEDQQRTASVPSAKDPIAAILAEPANDKPQALPANDVSSARILQVQKALNKAGFGPLKEDGDFGAGTRRALERFEAERKLTVRGEPSGKVLRELSKVAGFAVN